MRSPHQLLVAALLASSVVCCSRQEARDVHDVVLKTTDLACVMGSLIVDPVALQHYCRLADELLPIVRNLIGFREAGRRAGVSWAPPNDAPDASTEAGK